MSPIFQREVIASSRSPWTWWLRVILGTLCCLWLWLLSQNITQAPGGAGPGLFAGVHVGITMFLALLAPGLTADCVTRERRMGTLGLLLLTPLRPYQVIWGKIQHHALQLLAAWLACFPVSIVPVIYGGIHLPDILLAWSLEASVGIVGLTAGACASAQVRHRHHAWWFGYALAVPSVVAVLLGAILILGASAPLAQTTTGGSSLRQGLVSLLVLLGAAGLGTLWMAIAGRAAVRRWREEEFEPVQQIPEEIKTWQEFHDQLGDRWEEAWEDLEHQAWSNGPGRELRQRRPLEWLQLRERGRTEYRGWWVGLVGLGWLLTVATESSPVSRAVTLLLWMAVAIRASRGFREERLSAALELLLVSPIPIPDLLLSRVRLLFREFGPALFLHVFLTAWWLHVSGGPWGDRIFLGVLPGGFLGAIGVGIWTSLRFRALPAGIAAAGLSLAPSLLLGGITAGLLAFTLGLPWREAAERGETLAAVLLGTAATAGLAWTQVVADFRLRQHMTIARPAGSKR